VQAAGQNDRACTQKESVLVANPPLLGQFATTPIFNTKAVARETEVPADTFRAWERRYGIPRPERTSGGHRLYSERDIAVIRWLRDRTAEGMNISQAVMLLVNSPEQIPGGPLPPSQPRGMDRQYDDLLRALVQFEARQAERTLSEAFALHPFEDVLLHLVQPVMIELGELWASGDITVATEHFASAFVRRKLAGLINLFEGDPSRATILIACAPDELHDLGALLASLLMVRRGWHVVYLGAQVPQRDLLETIRMLSPDVVCLSATMPHTAGQLIEVAHAVQREFPTVRLGYAGRAFNFDVALREAMPGAYLGRDACEAVESVGALLARIATPTVEL
jgi:methanogenic corrinoid protein MtbC1